MVKWFSYHQTKEHTLTISASRRLLESMTTTISLSYLACQMKEDLEFTLST